MAYTGSIDLNIASILPEANRDESLFATTFKGGILLPYSGTAASANHGFAVLLKRLTELSGSRGAVIQDILSYAFDQGDLEIVNRNASGFSLRSGREVGQQEADRYIDALWSIGIDANTLRDNAKELYASYRTWGFAVLMCELTRVGTETRMRMIAGGLDHVVLGREKMPASSGIFDSSQPKRSRNGLTAYYFPQGILNLRESVEHYAFPVYESNDPALVELSSAQGFNRFGMVLRNGKGPYGRPVDISALRHMITEAAYAIHDEQVASVITTARSLITYPIAPELEDVGGYEPEQVESGEPVAKRPTASEKAKAAADGARKSMKDNDVAFLGYEGDKPPTLINIAINRDAAYRKAIDEIAAAKIYSANRWSTDMSGASNPAAGIGSEAFSHQIALRNRTVIGSAQSMVAAIQNEALLIALPQPEFENVIHKFPDAMSQSGIGLDNPASPSNDNPDSPQNEPTDA